MRATEETDALVGEPQTAFAQALHALPGAIRRLFPGRVAAATEHRLLRQDECLRVLPGRATALECRLGICLVTQEGDCNDHVLSASDVFRVAPRGVVVAWALTDSELMLRSR
jgi:hypothetical protein